MANQFVFLAVCAICINIVLGQMDMGYENQMMEQTALDDAQLGYPRRIKAGAIAGGFISHKSPFGHRTTKGGKIVFSICIHLNVLIFQYIDK